MHQNRSVPIDTLTQSKPIEAVGAAISEKFVEKTSGQGVIHGSNSDSEHQGCSLASFSFFI